MEGFVARIMPLISDDPALCLLPEEAGLHQVACRFEPRTPSGGVVETLPEDVREYLSRVVAKRRWAFLAGRYCAAQAIARVLPDESPWVGRAEDDTPRWPEGVVGSISHTGNVAMALVGSADSAPGMGVDVEARMSRPRAAQLAERILAGYPRCDRFEDAALLVTLTFSIKEALYKALYPLGTMLAGFDTADIVEWDHARHRCMIHLRTPTIGNPGLPRYFHADYAFNDSLVQSRVLVRSLAGRD